MNKNVLVLFDVDGTITPARRNIEDSVESYLQDLRTRVAVGLVGGSDLKKIVEQTTTATEKSSSLSPIEACVSKYDYVFAENGLVAYKNGKLLATQSLSEHLGEDKLQRFINFCLGHMSGINLPKKRGNFIEFRNGLINVCPVGRSCSQVEREEFNAYDAKHKVRETFIDKLRSQFGEDGPDPLGLVYSIGGQISFDAFPKGWDKTFCLNLIEDGFKEIHFFGDKTSPGGNDYEIFSDPRTIGHSVVDPRDTLEQLKVLNL